jgi:hypothetical protein
MPFSISMMGNYHLRLPATVCIDTVCGELLITVASAGEPGRGDDGLPQPDKTSADSATSALTRIMRLNENMTSMGFCLQKNSGPLVPILPRSASDLKVTLLVRE